MTSSYKKGTAYTQHFKSVYRKQLLETHNRHTSVQEGAGDYKKPKLHTQDPKVHYWRTPLLPGCCQGQMQQQFVPAHTGSDTPVHTGSQGHKAHLLQLTSWPLTRPFSENWMTELNIWEAFVFLYNLCNINTFIKGQKTTIHRKTFPSSGKFRTPSGPFLAVVPWQSTDITQQHYNPFTTNAQKPVGLSSQTPI